MAAPQKLSFVGKKPFLRASLHTLPFFGIKIAPSLDILNKSPGFFLHAIKIYLHGAEEANVTYLSC